MEASPFFAGTLTKYILAHEEKEKIEEVEESKQQELKENFAKLCQDKLLSPMFTFQHARLEQGISGQWGMERYYDAMGYYLNKRGTAEEVQRCEPSHNPLLPYPPPSYLLPILKKCCSHFQTLSDIHSL